jgi:hypothetical protein
MRTQSIIGSQNIVVDQLAKGPMGVASVSQSESTRCEWHKATDFLNRVFPTEHKVLV